MAGESRTKEEMNMVSLSGKRRIAMVFCTVVLLVLTLATAMSAQETTAPPPTQPAPAGLPTGWEQSWVSEEAVPFLTCMPEQPHVLAGQPIRLTVKTANYSANQQLRYEWSTSSGTVQPSGASAIVSTRANQRGIVQLTAKVSTAKGAFATCSISVLVIPGVAKNGAPKNYQVVKVFYATDRKPTSGAKPSDFYGPERNDNGELALGTCEVSIPRDHRMGELESPSLLRLEFRTDPEKHIVLLGVSPQTRDEFYREISDRASRSRRKEILVFVHGYDNTFEDAARRTAQLAYDLGFDGAPILYSWPSAGNPLSYPADETSVEWSTPHLKAFLEDLAARSGATTIHLVAHSMGNRAVAGALNTPATARSDTTPLFKHVVLAAPDIDAGVFKQLATTLKKSADHVTLYASSRDEALLASHIFHQYARAGESGNQIVVVEGVDTIDATAVSTGLGLEHSYFADNKSILTDLYYLLRDNAAPDSRFGLRRRANLGYWVFQP